MSKPKAGDLVESRIHGYIGMVFLVHRNFHEISWTTKADLDEWFRLQNPPLHPSLKKKQWVEVLLMQADTSVLLPADTVEILVPFSRIRRFLTEIAESSKKK
jgi:hypothetical protein